MAFQSNTQTQLELNRVLPSNHGRIYGFMPLMNGSLLSKVLPYPSSFWKWQMIRKWYHLRYEIPGIIIKYLLQSVTWTYCAQKTTIIEISCRVCNNHHGNQLDCDHFRHPRSWCWANPPLKETFVAKPVELVFVLPKLYLHYPSL